MARPTAGWPAYEYEKTAMRHEERTPFGLQGHLVTLIKELLTTLYQFEGYV